METTLFSARDGGKMDVYLIYDAVMNNGYDGIWLLPVYIIRTPEDKLIWISCCKPVV